MHKFMKFIEGPRSTTVIVVGRLMTLTLLMVTALFTTTNGVQVTLGDALP